MAATIKKDFLFKTIEGEKLSFWSVTDGRDIIAENQSCESPDSCIEELKELFENLDENSVTVKLCDKSKAVRAKGGKNFVYREYKIRLRESGVSGVQGNSLDLLSQIYELKNQIAVNNLKLEYDAQVRKLSEGKEENPVMLKGLELLAGFLSHGKPVAGLAGVNDAPIEEKINIGALDAQARVKGALVRLSKVDKDLPGSLELLADFAEKKPAEYLRFVPMVRGML